MIHFVSYRSEEGSGNRFRGTAGYTIDELNTYADDIISRYHLDQHINTIQFPVDMDMGFGDFATELAQHLRVEWLNINTDGSTIEPENQDLIDPDDRALVTLGAESNHLASAIFLARLASKIRPNNEHHSVAYTMADWTDRTPRTFIANNAKIKGLCYAMAWNLDISESASPAIAAAQLVAKALAFSALYPSQMDPNLQFHLLQINLNFIMILQACLSDCARAIADDRIEQIMREPLIISTTSQPTPAVTGTAATLQSLGTKVGLTRAITAGIMMTGENRAQWLRELRFYPSQILTQQDIDRALTLLSPNRPAPITATPTTFHPANRSDLLLTTPPGWSPAIAAVTHTITPPTPQEAAIRQLEITFPRGIHIERTQRLEQSAEIRLNREALIEILNVEALRIMRNHTLNNQSHDVEIENALNDFMEHVAKKLAEEIEEPDGWETNRDESEYAMTSRSEPFARFLTQYVRASSIQATPRPAPAPPVPPAAPPVTPAPAAPTPTLPEFPRSLLVGRRQEKNLEAQVEVTADTLREVAQEVIDERELNSDSSRREIEGALELFEEKLADRLADTVTEDDDWDNIDEDNTLTIQNADLLPVFTHFVINTTPQE